MIYIIFLLVSFCYIFKILFFDFFKRNLYADILSTPAGFYNLTDYLSGLEGFICQPFAQKVTRICQWGVATIPTLLCYFALCKRITGCSHNNRCYVYMVGILC